ncbi:hypothetical protein ACE14D_14545, partial [Streptomyces sp. Act-28]
MSSDQQYPYDPRVPRVPRDPSPYADRPYGEASFVEASFAEPSPADAEVAQTWQGQTWDTHYQPVIRPETPDGTAYPSPHGSGGYPTPPGTASGHPTGYDTPTAYLSPVTGHGPAPHGPSTPAHGRSGA